MESKKGPSIQFGNGQREFANALNKRVNDYFKVNNILKQGNSEMVIKSMVMFLMYFVPYFLIISNQVTNIPGIIGLIVLMAFGLSGVGLSVMHDANHGSYSKRRWLNHTIGYSLNLLGASSFNWKLQHNVLHHSYTNILEKDEDISINGILRMSPHDQWKSIHRYQHVYAWMLYSLLAISWIIFKDFSNLRQYQKMGLLISQKANLTKEWIILIATKIVYVVYAFLVPLLLTPFLWWQILIGLILMNCITGFILSIIFQPAHVTEGTDFPLPDETGTLENNWAIHQLRTTTNFGNNNYWFSWYIGGLNFQIEHHLFPHICHVHYRKIAPIVKSTAQEFGLPYNTSQTFLSALASHTRHLKQLGKKPLQIAMEVTETK